MAYFAFEEGTAGTISHSLAPRGDLFITVPRLSSREWLAIATSRRDGLSSLREPSRLSAALAGVFGLRRKPKLADPKLEAVRRLSVLARLRSYDIPSSEIRAFLAAGFTLDQYELVLDSVAAERAPVWRQGWRA